MSALPFLLLLQPCILRRRSLSTCCVFSECRASTKVTAAVLIFFCALLGALPAFVVLRRQQRQQQTEAFSSSHSNACPVLPSCCGSNYGAGASACCFGASPFYVRAATVYTAGVVASVALLHLLPAADRRLSKALKNLEGQGGPHWSSDYPAAALCCLVGLLLSAALEAVVEQQHQKQQEDREGDEDLVAVRSPDSFKQPAPLSAISPAQLRSKEEGASATAAPSSAEGFLSPVRLPFRWGEDQKAAAEGGDKDCCCRSDVGESPCRVSAVDLELSNDQPLASEQTYRSLPAAHQQHVHPFAHTAGYGDGSSTRSSRGDRRYTDRDRSAVAVAAPLSAACACCSSSTTSMEGEPRISSCPYTLMDDGAVGSAHTQQRKQQSREVYSQGRVSRHPSGCGARPTSSFAGSLLLTGLSIHSVMEGLTLGAAPNPKTIALAILFHKTLEAFAVGSSLLHGQLLGLRDCRSACLHAERCMSASRVTLQPPLRNWALRSSAGVDASMPCSLICAPALCFCCLCRSSHWAGDLRPADAVLCHDGATGSGWRPFPAVLRRCGRSR